MVVLVPSGLERESCFLLCDHRDSPRRLTDVDRPRYRAPSPRNGITRGTHAPTAGALHQWSRVYVDNHIMAAVEDSTGTLLRRKAGATLHVIHSVFTTPGTTTMEDTKDPISEKKLHKGDGRWDTTKEILVYMLDGIACTRSVWH
jgi:hypothetical protein